MANNTEPTTGELVQSLKDQLARSQMIEKRKRDLLGQIASAMNMTGWDDITFVNHVETNGIHRLIITYHDGMKFGIYAAGIIDEENGLHKVE